MAFFFKNVKKIRFFLQFWGITVGEKNRIFSARYFVAVSQYFLRDRMQMKDNTISHIRMKSKCDILPQGAGNSPECQSMLHTSTLHMGVK